MTPDAGSKQYREFTREQRRLTFQLRDSGGVSDEKSRDDASVGVDVCVLLSCRVGNETLIEENRFVSVLCSLH